MVIDSFIEWLVIVLGVVLATSVLWPAPFRLIGLFVSSLIPHPDTAAEWLRKIGL